MTAPTLPAWIREEHGAETAGRLSAALEATLAAVGLSLRLEESEESEALIEAAHGLVARVELADLARKAAHEPERIQPFLERMLTSLTIQAAALGCGELAQSVRVRLHPESAHAGAARHGVPCLTLLPDTVALLLYDQGSRLVGLQDPVWDQRPAAERTKIFNAAIDRTLAVLSVQREDLALPSGAALVSWTGDEHITSTLALAAERTLAADPRWGVLLAVPRSQTVIAHVIRDHTMIPAATQLALMARGIFEEGPEPRVSPAAYWVRGEHSEALQVEVDLAARRVTRFSPSQRFTDEVLLPLCGDHLRPA